MLNFTLEFCVSGKTPGLLPLSLAGIVPNTSLQERLCVGVFRLKGGGGAVVKGPHLGVLTCESIKPPPRAQSSLFNLA